MSAPPISSEKVQCIARLWVVWRCASTVARLAGVSPHTAMRYRPENVVPIHGNRLRDDLRLKIQQIWRECGSLREVMARARVSRSMAYANRPPSLKREPVTTGYHNWSKKARDRWDRFWSRPFNVERLGELLGRDLP